MLLPGKHQSQDLSGEHSNPPHLPSHVRNQHTEHSRGPEVTGAGDNVEA